MKRNPPKSSKIDTRTVRLVVIGAIVLGLASLLVGLSIYSNSLLQESISRTRTTAAKAAMVAEKSEDTVGLAKDVMGVYYSLTPEQLSLTGTEEYRQYFSAIESVSDPEGTSRILS